MVLSLSHLLLLILHYYLLLTPYTRKKANDNLGLILTAWITSAALGNMNVSSNHNVRRIIFIVTFSVAVIIIVKTYVLIFKIHTKKEKNMRMYQKQCLRIETNDTK